MTEEAIEALFDYLLLHPEQGKGMSGTGVGFKKNSLASLASTTREKAAGLE